MGKKHRAHKKIGKTYINLMRILKQCGIYENYIFNIYNSLSRLNKDEEYVRNDIIFSSPYFEVIINLSFVWELTNEGDNFWHDIYIILCKYKNCEIDYIITKIKQLLESYVHKPS